MFSTVTPESLSQYLEHLKTFKIPRRSQTHGVNAVTFEGTQLFNFFDRHLDENIELKHVALYPTLHNDLAHYVHHSQQNLKPAVASPAEPRSITLEDSTSHLFLAGQYDEVNEGDILTRDLIRDYSLYIAKPCLPLVSNWALHPQIPTHHSTIEFSHRGRYWEPQPSIQKAHSLQFKPADIQHPDLWSQLDNDTKDMISDLATQPLGRWLFLPLSLKSEQLVRDLDQLTKAEHQLPTSYRDPGVKPREPLPRPHDGSLPFLKIPTAPSSSSLKIPMNQTKPPGQPQEWGTVHPRASTFRPDTKITTEEFAHHIWQIAVESDATFVVVNCGNHERICIRHRKSQTLFISDFFDCTADEPSYTTIHLGLQTIIVQDAAERYRMGKAMPPSLPTPKIEATPLPVTTTTTTPITKKRQSEDFSALGRPKKRTKTDAAFTPAPAAAAAPQKGKSEEEVFWTDLSKRSLALLQLKFAHYNSPVPAPCLRTGGTLSKFSITKGTQQWSVFYKPTQYMLITLNSPIGEGYTGSVFYATLEMKSGDGTTVVTKEVIAKVSTDPEAQERLEHEYKAYRHLWQAKTVKRLPIIYGMFEDIDGYASVLVMEKLGASFRKRISFNEETQEWESTVTEEEKIYVQKLLSEIHKADLVHNDIRPENIILAPDGLPMIIDYDQAMIKPPERYKEREMKLLKDVLDAKVDDRGAWGLMTPPVHRRRRATPPR